MPTSLSTSAGTWASFPMGDLSDSYNSFWQLFAQGPGSSTWANHVQATAVATNGGLAVAANGGEVAVGVRPWDKLAFSPIVSSTDEGTTWSNGLLSNGLSPVVDALALSPAGDALAIVDSRGSREVLASQGTLTDWTRAATLGSISSSGAAASCGPVTFSAVAYAGESPMVATSCSKNGALGIFVGGVGNPGGYKLARVVLPHEVSSISHTKISVLSLRGFPQGVSALFLATSPSRTYLVAGWSTDGLSWGTSAPLQLAPGEKVSSFGTGEGTAVTSADTQFAVTKAQTGAHRAFVVDGPSATWQQLPAPPAGIATLAVDGWAPPQALTARGTTLEVWTLSSPQATWDLTQTVNVAIQFGSSG